MWFHTNWFVPPKQFLHNSETSTVQAKSFTFSGESK